MELLVDAVLYVKNTAVHMFVCSTVYPTVQQYSKHANTAAHSISGLRMLQCCNTAIPIGI